MDALRRSEQFWFDAGDVVLLVGAGEEQQLFKVHRRVLVCDSPKFRAIMDGLDPAAGDLERFDGSPVLKLSDSIDDMTILLTALYNHEFFTPLTPKVFLVIARLLRMGTRYEVTHIRRQAIGHLATIFPRTLEELDTNNSLPQGSDQRLCLPPLPHPLVAVTILLETNAQILLPSAFRILASNMSTATLFDGIHLGDGAHVVLPPEVIRTTIIGRDLVRQATCERLFTAVCQAASPDCQQILECSDRRLRLELLFYQKFTANALDLDFEAMMSAHRCRPCATSQIRVFRETRESIWQSLPQIFRLGSWQRLQEPPRELNGRRN